jgi:hypothetical protein
VDLGEIGWGGVKLVHLAEDRDWWRALVDTLMNFRVLAPRNYRIRQLIRGSVLLAAVYCCINILEIVQRLISVHILILESCLAQ